VKEMRDAHEDTTSTQIAVQREIRESLRRRLHFPEEGAGQQVFLRFRKQVPPEKNDESSDSELSSPDARDETAVRVVKFDRQIQRKCCLLV
jgi:hypothetical protein